LALLEEFAGNHLIYQIIFAAKRGLPGKIGEIPGIMWQQTYLARSDAISKRLCFSGSDMDYPLWRTSHRDDRERNHI
jgi:hypothetical protein